MTLGKEEQNHPFLAERYTESISLPEHEQLLRYAERLAFVQNHLFVLPHGGLVSHCDVRK